MKNLKAMSLPELGEYQRELEAERTQEFSLNNYLARLSTEMEIAEREEEIEQELARQKRADFVAKYGEEALADIANQL